MRSKASVLFVTLLASVVFPTKTKSFDHSLLLTKEDIELEASERHESPALSSAPDAVELWESYNQWMCFESDAVELLKVRTSSGDFGDSTIPVIAASTPGHFFEISIFGEGQNKNDEIFERWQYLLEGSRLVCAYAAYLNGIDVEDGTPGSTWIVVKLKTEKGSWTSREP